jgi:hypothetical protein
MKHALLVSIFLFTIFICSYAQIKDANDSLANAYQIAKVLGRMKNNENYKGADIYKQVLGSLIWYANLQDIDKAERKTELQKKLTRYIGLKINIEDWQRTIFRNYMIFSDSINDIITKINSKVVARSENEKKIKNDLIEKMKEYHDNINELKNDSIREVDKRKSFELTSLRINDISRDTLIEIDSIQLGKLKIELNEINIELSGFKVAIKKISLKIAKTRESILRILDSDRIFFDLILSINQINGDYFTSAELISQSLESFSASNITINNQKAADEQAKQSLNFKLPSQAQMIDALAIYLAKRVKQETVLWFFETITKNASKFELLQTFYPNTIGLLQSKEVYETPNMGTQWQYALSKDFVSLPENLFNSQWLAARIPEDKKPYLDFLKATPKIASLITQRYNYQDLVRNMYLEYSDTENEISNVVTVKDVFTLLYAINNEMYTYQNFKSKNGDSLGIRMLRYEDLRVMTKEEIEIMLSLIDMKYNKVFSKMLRLTNAETEFKISLTQAEDIRKWIGRIQLGVEQLDKIRGTFIQQQELFEAGGKKDMAFSNYNIWLFLSELFKLVLPEKADKWLSDKTTKASSAIKYIGQTQEIYNLISTKNFSGAVNTTIDLIDSLFYGGGANMYKKKIDDLKNLVDNKYVKYIYLSSTINEIVSTLNDTNKRNAFINKTTGVSFIGDSASISFKKNSQFAAVLFEQNRHALVIIRKLGGFLNDAAFATNSKQLARVVESYAMPPGSYKRKRNSWWSVDLNAFVGPYVGLETIRTNSSQIKSFEKNQYVYGFSAPIGISISKTFGRKLKDTVSLDSDQIKNPDKIKVKKNGLFKRTKSTLTLTFSLIDLGAVVSYRFDNTKDSILPQQAKWSQVISPGVHLAYGIPSTPLVLQTGFQLTPQLRRVGEVIEQRQYSTKRFYAGVMFDIPLFNLWSRNRIVYTK